MLFRSMESPPYLNSIYNSIKDLAPLDADAWKNLKRKLTELMGVFPDFNPWQFAGRYAKGFYGDELPVSLFIHAIEGLITIKAKRTAGELVIFKAWGYVQSTITNEISKGWLSRDRHEQFKREELADFAQKEKEKDFS